MLMSKNIIFFISLPFINWNVRMGSSSLSPHFGNRSISCYVPQPKLCIMSKRGLRVTNIVFPISYLLRAKTTQVFFIPFQCYIESLYSSLRTMLYAHILLPFLGL